MSVNAKICDAPARSYIKCVYLDHTMTYPELKAFRTDADFRSCKDEEHHLLTLKTPLLELNRFNCAISIGLYAFDLSRYYKKTS